jgi:hypothetical protein
MNITPVIFEDYDIRRVYDEKTETWYFSVVDIIRALLQQPDFQAARKYWNKLKERLGKEGSEPVTNCHRLKLIAEDGKMRLTDVASPEVLLRLIQSVPSPWSALVSRSADWCGFFVEEVVMTLNLKLLSWKALQDLSCLVDKPLSDTELHDISYTDYISGELGVMYLDGFSFAKK